MMCCMLYLRGLKGPHYAYFQVHISVLCLYCVQKGLYFSHTACATAPRFTLCLKPEPSMLWLVSWPSILWLVNRCLAYLPFKLPWMCWSTCQWKHKPNGGRECVWELWDFSLFQSIYLDKNLYNITLLRTLICVSTFYSDQLEHFAHSTTIHKVPWNLVVLSVLLLANKLSNTL